LLVSLLKRICFVEDEPEGSLYAVHRE